VPQPSRHALHAGGPSRRGGAKVAAEASEVLVVLLQQDSQQLLRRDEATEATLLIDDGQAGFAVLEGLPRRVFLVGVWADDGWSPAITSSTAVAGAAARRRSSVASPTRRSLSHTATTATLSKSRPRIPARTASTGSPAAATGTFRVAPRGGAQSFAWRYPSIRGRVRHAGLLGLRVTPSSARPAQRARW